MSKSELNVTSRVQDSYLKNRLLLYRVEKQENEFSFGSLFEFNESKNEFDLISNDARVHLDPNLDIVPFDFVTIINSKIRLVYSARFKSNTVFTTVRCNSNCIMCSQPPLENEDGKFNLAIWYKINELIEENEIKSLGFSGGEPTILGEDLVHLINALTSKHLDLSIDVLSNGRRLGQNSGKELLKKFKHPERVQFCIPLYSGISYYHDYIVQARKSFWDTVNALFNCNYFGFKTEVRLVIQKDTIENLGYFVKFIRKNLWFVNHFALMGLEQVGYAKSRFDEIDVTNSLKSNELFQQALVELSHEGLNVSIYNLPICYLPTQVHKYARQSISEWKNSYHSDCDSCNKKSECSGFFSWNINPSTNVYPFT